MEITSSSNKTFKFIKGLSRKKERRIAGAYIIEGIKSVNDAINSECDIQLAAVTEGFKGRLPDCPIYTMPEYLFEKLADTQNPQGIMAVVKMVCTRIIPKEGGLYLYCDNVSDPGNMGTLIRTADAVAADGVILSEGCVDVYNPKTVRACMGSLFHIPVAEDDGSFIDECTAMGFNIYAGALRRDTIDYRLADYGDSTVIIVGNEANGVSENVLNKAKAVKIPIAGKAESLNAAVAGAVLLYEAFRNRNSL